MAKKLLTPGGLPMDYVVGTDVLPRRPTELSMPSKACWAMSAGFGLRIERGRECQDGPRGLPSARPFAFAILPAAKKNLVIWQDGSEFFFCRLAEAVR
eukprot:1312008-Pyramimonas_sp.AAC.1